MADDAADKALLARSILAIDGFVCSDAIPAEDKDALRLMAQHDHSLVLKRLGELEWNYEQKQRDYEIVCQELKFCQDKLAAAQHRNKALVGALEPFARLAGAYDGSHIDAPNDREIPVLLGDLRFAQAALAANGGEEVCK